MLNEYDSTCSGGFGHNLSSVGIVDNKNLRDGNKEECVVSVVGTTIDNVRIRRFRFRLNNDKVTICSDHF